METLSYPYEPKAWVIPGGIVFFGAAAFVLGRKAMTDDRGLIATLFYGSAAAASAAFVLFIVAAFFVGRKRSHRMTLLTLSATEISAPKSLLSRDITVVRIDDITRLGIRIMKKRRFLYIYHSKGKLMINEALLPNSSAFDRVYSTLSDRLAARSRS